MSDYSIKHTLEYNGIEVIEGNQPTDTLTDWIVESITQETVTITHPTGVTVTIKQTSPFPSDYPFTVTRTTTAGDTYRLTESDWPGTAFDAATAFMIGYSEALNSPHANHD